MNIFGDVWGIPFTLQRLRNNKEVNKESAAEKRALVLFKFFSTRMLNND